jgi:protein-tyrosine-phosphatase
MRLLRWLHSTRTQHVDVLVVCRANYTRSPYIAADLRRRLAGRASVGSAGTSAVKAKNGVDRLVLPHVSARGLDPADLADHEPQQLTAQMITDATLVIAATREVRGVIDSMAPGTTDRVFTLLELAALLRDAPDATGLGVAGVADLAATRRTREILADESTDLADPRGEAPAAYRHMIDTVSLALDVIGPAIASAPSSDAEAGPP